MSFKNLADAMELAKKRPHYRTRNGKPDTLIKKAENLLGINFSNQLTAYLQQLGYLSFSGNEVFGLTDDSFSGVAEGNIVEYTLHDRKTYNLPNQWIPICNLGDGMLAFQDYSQVGDGDEPPIIEAYYDGSEFVIAETLADDFGDFLLQLVQE